MTTAKQMLCSIRTRGRRKYQPHIAIGVVFLTSIVGIIERVQPVLHNLHTRCLRK